MSHSGCPHRGIKAPNAIVGVADELFEELFLLFSLRINKLLHVLQHAHRFPNWISKQLLAAPHCVNATCRGTGFNNGENVMLRHLVPPLPDE